MGQIDVDLVDPTVFNLRRNVGDGCLEEPRITSVLSKSAGTKMA
jgi:hypothetical protein